MLIALRIGYNETYELLSNIHRTISNTDSRVGLNLGAIIHIETLGHEIYRKRRMNPTKNQLKNALRYIESNYDFDVGTNPDVRNYLIDNNLIEVDGDNDLVFVTAEGELYLGATKAELRDKYDEDSIGDRGTYGEDVETYEEDFDEQEQYNDDEF